ncbi:secretory calcium-binding phosphoprotein 7 [Notolabrus celidotus]|uniref:secretory calcium-binding phosphoprotein 7 n=1 Tax=Notolabrus celidotus TaxID=1203425 RepID=UPI00149022F7|nr:secretory calcium-binding phosphoprotein 7 [Notolabrus celidotus]
MKFVLIAACILGMAVCAPPQMYMEFDIEHAPAEAVQAIPAGVPAGTLEVLLPVDAQKRPLAGPVRGFIKQEIPHPSGVGTKEVYIPFGFDPALAAPAAPVAPVVLAAPVDTIVPVAPVDTIVPVGPVDTIIPVAPAVPAAPAAPAARPLGDDDDDDD